MAVDPQRIRDVVREAQENVARAISVIAALGPDAPSSLRTALNGLSLAYADLGWSDPAVPYGIPSEETSR